MASRTPRGSDAGYTGTASRTNEYFVPRDGIDREVITADICRYLGNDALVRPGNYTDPLTNQVVQGYYITAYRNLTTAMISDLKNDSARWEAERRRQSGSGAIAGRYQDSAIRDTPQRSLGGGNGGSSSGYSMSTGYGGPASYENAPRYPGSEAPGYSSGSVPGAPPYGAHPGGFPQGMPPQGTFGGPLNSGLSSDPRYVGNSASPPAGPGPGVGLGAGVGYGNSGNGAVGGVMAAPEGYTTGSYYLTGSNRRGDAYSQDMVMDDPPPAPVRRTSPPGAGLNSGFITNPSAQNYRPPFNVSSGGAGSYGAYGAPISTGGSGSNFGPPVDHKFGRAPNMPNQGFSSTAHEVPVQQQQYEEPTYTPSPSHSGSSAASTQTQLASPSGLPSGPPPGHSGSSGPPRRTGNERSDYRDRDRDRVDRMAEREHRDNTPPNRTGSANKPPGTSIHHYGRR